MPGTTPNLDLPYPLPTDQVSAGAGDIRALAEAIDPLLANSVEAPGATDRYKLQAGQIATGDLASQAIFTTEWDFAEWFGALSAPDYVPPVSVIATVEATGNGGQGSAAAPGVVWLVGTTYHGFTVCVRNTSIDLWSFVVHWMAFGQK